MAVTREDASSAVAGRLAHNSKAPMTRSLLEHCAGARTERLNPGAFVLAEGQRASQLYVLIEGEFDMSRGGVQIASIKEPGSILGEMPVFMDRPNAVTVTARSAAEVHAFDDAQSFFRSDVDIGFLIARLPAQRLNAATSYLADVSQQYTGQGIHLAMVEEVPQSLIHEQYEEIAPGSVAIRTLSPAPRSTPRRATVSDRDGRTGRRPQRAKAQSDGRNPE